MRQPTELMRAILTDKMAQEIIDWVAPVYGNSYVGLWMFQAIGTLIGEVRGICEALMYETSPATATLLLDQWEDQYGLPRDSSLTIEQRRARIVQKRLSHGPCNPATLAMAVSNALGGVQVHIKENVSRNTFAVILAEEVADDTPARAVLDRMKPAHLIYEIRTATDESNTTKVGIGIAATQCEIIEVEVTR